ncbi:Protein FAM110C [Triplophysa tibetana]|uniref:Protein FAM110C n=1 Tax=Triplophysa tibetana TaxID=1572043 RepID=A0A5A9ND98_9TELE|nr:Protein FAM110C [Triplophysa tibetana]
MLKKTQGSADVDASRILGKGPEFLRKQIERESEGNVGRVSAVERLAASKPQYVKSQQVGSSTQEPVGLVSALVSTQRSSNGHGSVRNATSADVEDAPKRQEETNVVRRISSKKRDSILLYRQKCDLVRGSPGGIKTLIKKSIKGKTSEISEAQCDRFNCETEIGTTRKESSFTSLVLNGSSRLDPQSRRTDDPPRAPCHRRVAETQEQERKSRRGVARSSSDISSRYSKHFLDFDVFFKYCGLEGDVIESMGKENFYARSDDLGTRNRSVSVATSEDAFSKSSGHSDGLQEEELQEQVRQGSSVVERNARIIKWLYSCRNAAEAGKTLRALD